MNKTKFTTQRLDGQARLWLISCKAGDPREKTYVREDKLVHARDRDDAIQAARRQMHASHALPKERQSFTVVW